MNANSALVGLPQAARYYWCIVILSTKGTKALMETSHAPWRLAEASHRFADAFVNSTNPRVEDDFPYPLVKVKFRYHEKINLDSNGPKI